MTSGWVEEWIWDFIEGEKLGMEGERGERASIGEADE